MRIPRDVGGEGFAKRLRKLDCHITRQTGSHMRLTRRIGEEDHYITIPMHRPLKIGTLSNILKDIAHHLEIDSPFCTSAIAPERSN